MCDWNSRFRGTLYYTGGRTARESGNSVKGKNSHSSHSEHVSARAVKIRKKKKIATGELFITENGKGMSRCQIWAEMKRLRKHAGVDSHKVFPHNLRHMFATTFYRLIEIFPI